MKLSENWLRALVDLRADRAALVQGLTMAGLEVEAVTALGEGLQQVRVAQIVDCQPHPQADRLRVCRVEVGEPSPLTNVCGAPNARIDLKVPLAMIGATLPGGVTIKAAALRGVESQGMLCSARELGLDADAAGLLELPDDAPVGMPLADYLGLPDACIELKLTPNRPDCLGLLGLAHDVAALFDAPLRPPPLQAVPVQSGARRGMRLEAGADCPRYLGRIIEDIDAAAATPIWMAERLRRAGLRCISAVVDVTNYVMLELGQPLHAFDNDMLHGEIVVRHASESEHLILLGGSEVVLDPRFLLIADASGPLAVAGVMGGQHSAVNATTRNVFLESAHFAPAAIMGRARRLGLHTDASHRFERGVDPELPERALERATALLLAIAGGRPGPILRVERPQDLPLRAEVALRRARLAMVLGITVDDGEVERILRALGMQVAADDAGWRVRAPTRRFDIEREEDLIEEVARMHGYDRIPVLRPSGELVLVADSEERLPVSALREQLAARDYHEAISLAFVAAAQLEIWKADEGAVVLSNPLSADLAVMRTTLLPGLAQSLVANRNRQLTRVRLFEAGRCFQEGPDAPVETERLAAIASGTVDAEQWGVPGRSLDFHDLKGDLESLLALGSGPIEYQFDADGLPGWLHPGRGARIRRGSRVLGALGALHPRLLKALGLEEDVHAFEIDLDPLRTRALPRAGELPRFPGLRRDLALEMPQDVPWAAVAASVRGAVGERLAELRLFDQYAGQGVTVGHKSLAMGLILQDRSRTLTDEDANESMREAVAALQRDCHARLRG